MIPIDDNTAQVNLSEIAVDEIVCLINAYVNRPNKPSIEKLNGLRALTNQIEHSRRELITRMIYETSKLPPDQAPM